MPLQKDGLLRIKEVLEIVPVSRSAWWAGVKDGRYPKPVKLGPRTTAWKVSDILEYLDSLSHQTVEGN